MLKTANVKREEFYCAHCGKEYGDHQANLFNCPSKKGRNGFKLFDKLHTFTPNYDKPLTTNS